MSESVFNVCMCVFAVQGPEHSSARPERYLQMCSDDPDIFPVSAALCVIFRVSGWHLYRL